MKDDMSDDFNVISECPLGKMGINTQALIEAAENAVEKARMECPDEMGPVNWGDIGVGDIEVYRSVLYPEDGPRCRLILEEAAASSKLALFVHDEIKGDFPNVEVECDW